MRFWAVLLALPKGSMPNAIGRQRLPSVHRGFQNGASSCAFVAALLMLVASGCAQQQSAAASNPSLEPPPAPREFRGVWVATVGNIDWPSKPGLSTQEQQAEAIRILDKAAELNMNAVVFQVRPACDAMYDSKIEPW